MCCQYDCADDGMTAAKTTVRSLVDMVRDRGVMKLAWNGGMSGTQNCAANTIE